MDLSGLKIFKQSFFKFELVNILSGYAYLDGHVAHRQLNVTKTGNSADTWRLRLKNKIVYIYFYILNGFSS